MTAEEEALMTQLTEGPVPEAGLDEATAAVARHMVGRNVVVYYPMADGTEGRQLELTQVGQMSVAAEQPPPPEEGAPVLSSLNPTGCNKGDPSATVTASGSGFSVTATVRADGADLPTTFVDDTNLTAVYTPSHKGTIQFEVYDGELTSNSLPFEVT